jgi:6-phosphogluconolactonase (cycloisomerase 2 family)
MVRSNRSKCLSLVFLLAVEVSALVLGGCGGSQSPPPPPPPKTLTSIQITPADPSVPAGSTQQFAAKGSFSDGSIADITSSVTWSSSDTTLASITAGLASAAAIGRPQITAMSGAVSGSTRLIIVSPATPTVARFAYVTAQTYDPPSFNGTISMYTVNPATGQLRPGGYIIAGQAPGRLTVEPRNKFAYVVNGSLAVPTGGNMISAFSIDPATGSLTAIAGSPFPTGETSLGGNLVVEPRGKFVYAVSSSGDALEFVIDQLSGALKPVTGAHTTSTGGLNLIAVDPSGAFVYFTDFNQLFGFEIDPATGALTPVPGSPLLAGGTDMTVDPSGHFLYVVFGDIIYAFAIDPATGALTTLPSAFNQTTGVSTAEITVDPAGKFLYVAHDGLSLSDPSSYIAVYSIDPDGGITQQRSHFPTRQVIPHSIGFDPVGKFLYVTEAGSSVEVFSVGASGALTSVGSIQTRSSVQNEITLSVGSNALSYLPKFAYVADAGSNDVTAYTINASTGALTSAGTVVAANPSSVTVDPFVRFAYVARQGDNSVGAYSVNATTGALSGIGTAVAGSNPVSAAVDPSGRFVYVANKVSNDVSTYSADPTTGLLASLGTVTAGTTAVALAIDPTGQYVLIANQGSSDVSIYSIDVNSGMLASDGILDTGQNPPPPRDTSGRTSITVDPSGRFVYVGGNPA